MSPEDFGVRLKAARHDRRLSQLQLSRVLGVDRKTVDNWENGRARPSPLNEKLIRDVLGVSTDDDSTGSDLPPEVERYAEVPGVLELWDELGPLTYIPLALRLRWIAELAEERQRPLRPARRQAG